MASAASSLRFLASSLSTSSLLPFIWPEGTFMRRHLVTAVLYTVVTTVIFGLIYPFVVTGLAQVLFHDKANGQLLYQNGQLVGSRIIGQPFSAPQYFHPRPSFAGNGYDAANSSGSNYAPTNKKLIDRVA